MRAHYPQDATEWPFQYSDLPLQYAKGPPRQALSIKHIVRGCLEGVFAFGQVYVLVSRVTDPNNFHLVGVPPKDLVEAVHRALYAAGEGNPAKWFDGCTGVSGEWEFYETRDYPERFRQKRVAERSVPMVHRTLQEALNPQPAASNVMKKLLGWIDRVDAASQSEHPSRPRFAAEDGSPIFPREGDDDEFWWLTDISKRKLEQQRANAQDLEDGPDSDSSDMSDPDCAGDVAGGKKRGLNSETSDDESSDTQHPVDDSLASSSQACGPLPLKKARHSSRAFFEDSTPSSQPSSSSRSSPLVL